MCQFRLTVPRIRHLKCDEEKPVCRRCRDDNRTCDGYQHATERARERRRMRHPGGRVGQPNSQRAVIQVFPSALWDISGQELGRSSFYHVISCTLKDCGSSAFISRFWLEHVLPLGHYVEPIKYGLMALGSAHRSFLKKHVRNMYVSDNQWDDHVATVQYNIAIRHVTQVISSPSPASIEITLICCLIFTCFDTMQGNYDRALQHLRAGSTILYFLGTSSENSSNLNRLYDIAGVFSRFGVDMSLLIEDQITRDLSFYTRYTTRDSVARPFSNVLEVQEELHIVELAFGMGDDNDQDPSLVGSCSEWQTAVDGFEYWSKGLDLYQCSLTEKESTDQEMHKLVILSFHQKVWSVIIKQNPECEIITPEQEDLNDIISFAEQHVFPSLPATTHSIFALDASIIPPLAFVCGFSKEPSLIQRAIKLLRSLNRRELMWDSSEIADIYEAVLLAKSQNMWDEEYCQLSIPELARKLVCLGFLERNFTSTVVSQIN